MLAAVIYPFVWLYEKIGGIGYLVLIGSVSGVWVYVSSQKKGKDTARRSRNPGGGLTTEDTNSGRPQSHAQESWQGATIQDDSSAEDFEGDALLAISRRLDQETARALNAKYSRSSHRRVELLRFIQVFTDSVEISLSSKKADTAESRMALAKETYQKINAYRDIMGPRLRVEVDTKYQHLEANFISALTLNVAKAHIEKARSLKTEKSRMKYLQEALDVLEEGLSRGAGASPEVLALAEEVRTKVGERT